MVKRKIEKRLNVGALSFKTCLESFSLANAVPLTSSHAAEPRCITMIWECPPCQGNLHRAKARWGRGRQRAGGGQTKGNLISPGHGSSTSQKREIHHLWDQTETCAQGTAQWKLHPPMHPLSFLSPLLSSHWDGPRPHHDSHRHFCVSFERTLWNPAYARRHSGPDNLRLCSL